LGVVNPFFLLVSFVGESGGMLLRERYRDMERGNGGAVPRAAAQAPRVSPPSLCFHWQLVAIGNFAALVSSTMAWERDESEI